MPDSGSASLRLIRAADLSAATAQTAGMVRAAAISGDLVGAPAGTEAHQLINTGTEDLRCIALSSGGGADVVEYPDSGKVGIAAGIKNSDFRTATIAGMGRLQKADYWEGE